ncbi:MAG: hypothetical protein JNL28_16945 [Planctomycetes bacterium]|nr:hypothetical protein [Planctomycetota bacterium]
MSKHISLCGLVAAACVVSSTASAQVASAIVRIGDAPAGTGAGVTITSISGAAANEAGGVGVRVTLSNTNAAFWGHATSTAGSILREEQLGISGYDQTAFEGFFGIADSGSLSYSPTCTDLMTLATGLDCAWLDSTPIAVEEQPIPTLAGKKYRFASRPGITPSGIPYWVSGINDIATNANEGNGLFFGVGQTVILKTGDPSPAPLTSLLGSSAADFDVRFSKNGTHNISVITTTDPTTADTHLVIDGAIVLDAGGSRISEGQPVSVSAGGMVGENWSNFSSLGVNEAGDWFAAGDTSAATTIDGFIVKNGVILYREGNVLGGLTLVGNVPTSPGAYMNDAGDIGFAWDTTGSITGIFLNSTLLLKEGDPVDFDNDGIVEATSIFKAASGIASMSVGNKDMFFQATVTVAGTDVSCVLKIALPSTPTTSFCEGDAVGTTCLGCGNNGAPGKGCANFAFVGGGQLAASGIAGASAGTDTLVLTATDITGPGLFFQADGVAGSPVTFGDGMLCATIGIIRMGVVFPSGGGVASYPGGLTPNPIHIAGGALAGQTKHYQCWYRDAGETSPGVSFCTPSTFNLTQGVSLTWGP